MGLDESRKDLFVDIKHLEINFEHIIGKGSTSTVYSGKLNGASPIQNIIQSLETREFSDCKVAVKIGSDFNEDSVEKLLNEIEFAKKIKFEKNICCLLGWTFFRGNPCLIFELVDSNLLQYSKQLNKKNFVYKTVLKIFWQICSGMEKVASIKVIHRDLAARNILLNSNLFVKIADFGLCCSLDENYIYNSKVENKFPIRWLSLEAMTERLFSELSDVWSFGILSYEVFSFGGLPYSNLENRDIVEYLRSGKRLERLENIPDTYWDIMKSCWAEETTQRPTFYTLKDKIRILLENENENYGYLQYEEES